MRGGVAEPPAPAVGLEGADEAEEAGGDGQEHGGIAAGFYAPADMPGVEGEDESGGEADAGAAEGGAEEDEEPYGENAAGAGEEAEAYF